MFRTTNGEIQFQRISRIHDKWNEIETKPKNDIFEYWLKENNYWNEYKIIFKENRKAMKIAKKENFNIDTFDISKRPGGKDFEKWSDCCDAGELYYQKYIPLRNLKFSLGKLDREFGYKYPKIVKEYEEWWEKVATKRDIDTGKIDIFYEIRNGKIDKKDFYKKQELEKLKKEKEAKLESERINREYDEIILGKKSTKIVIDPFEEEETSSSPETLENNSKSTQPTSNQTNDLELAKLELEKLKIQKEFELKTLDKQIELLKLQKELATMNLNSNAFPNKEIKGNESNELSKDNL